MISLGPCPLGRSGDLLKLPRKHRPMNTFNITSVNCLCVCYCKRLRSKSRLYEFILHRLSSNNCQCTSFSLAQNCILMLSPKTVEKRVDLVTWHVTCYLAQRIYQLIYDLLIQGFEIFQSWQLLV